MHIYIYILDRDQCFFPLWNIILSNKLCDPNTVLWNIFLSWHAKVSDIWLQSYNIVMLDENGLVNIAARVSASAWKEVMIRGSCHFPPSTYISTLLCLRFCLISQSLVWVASSNFIRKHSKECEGSFWLFVHDSNTDIFGIRQFYFVSYLSHIKCTFVRDYLTYVRKWKDINKKKKHTTSYEGSICMRMWQEHRERRGGR